MATLVGKERTAVEMLKNLIELDFDAVEAYEEAVSRSNDVTNRQALASFQLDHERHISDLSAMLRQIGETPPSKGDVKRLLTQGKVVLAALVGDKAILQAMKSNEEDTNTAYERACSRTDLPPGALDLLTLGLADERRHRDWIVMRVQQLDAAEAAATHQTP